METVAEAPTEKPKFPRGDAIIVAREMVVALASFCEPERIVVAGSLRRRKALVGDVELVFVPQMMTGKTTDLFAPPPEVPRTDAVFAALLASGTIEKRLNVKGSPTWGPLNKLARHVASGIPIDFFQTDEESFWGYLVCRTGGMRNNIEICTAAIAMGWKYDSYDGSFSRSVGLGRERHRITSEREAFEFVGLRYLEPWERK